MGGLISVWEIPTIQNIPVPYTEQNPWREPPIHTLHYEMKLEDLLPWFSVPSSFKYYPPPTYFLFYLEPEDNISSGLQHY